MIKKIFFLVSFILSSSLFVLSQSFLNNQQYLKEELGNFMHQGDLEGVVKKLLEAKEGGIEEAILREIFSKMAFLKFVERLSSENKDFLKELLVLLKGICVEKDIVDVLKAKIEQAEQPPTSQEEQASEPQEKQAEDEKPSEVDVSGENLIPLLMDLNNSDINSELEVKKDPPRILYGIIVLAGISLMLYMKNRGSSEKPSNKTVAPNCPVDEKVSNFWDRFMLIDW